MHGTCQRVAFALSHTSTLVVHGHPRTPAKTPGPRHKEKIRYVFSFQKQAIDMQTAGSDGHDQMVIEPLFIYNNPTFQHTRDSFRGCRKSFTQPLHERGGGPLVTCSDRGGGLFITCSDGGSVNSRGDGSSGSAHTSFSFHVLETLEDSFGVWSALRFPMPALLCDLPDLGGHSWGVEGIRLQWSCTSKDQMRDHPVAVPVKWYFSSHELETKIGTPTHDTIEKRTCLHDDHR